MPILHVLHCAPKTAQQADDALRALRRALLPAGDDREVLLFCDLPDAPFLQMPQDDALVRRLQSGVMSLAQRQDNRALLLVRRRCDDAATHSCPGSGQCMPYQQVIAQLHAHGKTDAAFAAATFTPSSLKGRFSAVLFCSVDLACTPDTPPRLAGSAQPCACGNTAFLFPGTPPLLLHLLAQGFSFADGRVRTWPPVLMMAAEALCACTDGFPASMHCESVPNCVFAQKCIPAVRDLLMDANRLYLTGPVRTALLPVFQIALLLLAALLGAPLIALAVLILPEYRIWLFPRKWPCALIRAAFLPMHAAQALDALLFRAFSGADVRILLPDAAKGAPGSVLLGATALILALSSVHALPLFLPLSLLWMLSPLIARALDLPVSERIPLSGDQKQLLRGEAESVYFALEHEAPGENLLCACAATMLGILEPDEAARRAQESLPTLTAHLHAPDAGAFTRAALLTGAQYFRENMANCDAALRALPTQLENLVLTASPPEGNSLLSQLIRAAIQNKAQEMDVNLPHADDAADALFLPQVLLTPLRSDDDLLPLTRPHTYLRRSELLPDQGSAAIGDGCGTRPALRMLSLAAAALDRPFEKLFLRSPVIEPYLPALASL